MQQMKEQTPDGGEGAKKELGGFLTVEDIAEGVRVVVDDVVGGRVRGGGVMRVTYRGGYDYWFVEFFFDFFFFVIMFF